MNRQADMRVVWGFLPVHGHPVVLYYATRPASELSTVGGSSDASSTIYAGWATVDFWHECGFPANPMSETGVGVSKLATQPGLPSTC